MNLCYLDFNNFIKFRPNILMADALILNDLRHTFKVYNL